MNAISMSKSSKKGEMSQKFVKELNKFFDWAKEAKYVIMSAKDNKERNWDMDLMKNFEEPGRNKLEGYIRELQKTYVIWSSKESNQGGVVLNDEVDDYKLLAKEYKDARESEQSKRKRTESTETEMSKTDMTNFVVSESIDTSETFYVDTLELSTETLKEKLGEPMKTGQEEDEHSFEWKLLVGENVYSIYDWREKEIEMEDKTWHVGCTVMDKKGLNGLKKQLANKKAKIPIKKHKIEVVQEEECGSVYEQGSEDDESVDINLDDLSFD
jgi:hypothetical protein